MLDRWFWSLEGSSEFLVKSTRILINDFFHHIGDVLTRWVKLVPIKINIFAWRVFLVKLPTRLNLSLRGVEIPSILCPICNVATESPSHLLFTCPLARHVRCKVLRWWDIDEHDYCSYDEWLLWFKSIDEGLRSEGTKLIQIFIKAEVTFTKLKQSMQIYLNIWRYPWDPTSQST
ncbi:RNA-directed DNA polymerase, eukaryota [Tanacetum coccineum]